MAFVSSFVLVTGLFLLIVCEHSCGRPANHQLRDYAKKSSTADEANSVKKLLKDASRELTDDQALHILRNSMLLYFKVCLFPYPPLSFDKVPAREGAVEDDNSSPSKGKGLRDLLLESAELVNPEKAMGFLKSSIKFRLLYCFLPSFNTSSPMHTTQETGSEATEGMSLRNSSETRKESGPMQEMNEVSNKDKEPALLKEFTGPNNTSNDTNLKNFDSEKKLSNDLVSGQNLKQPVADTRLKEPITSKKLNGAPSTNRGINSESAESEKMALSNAILSGENLENTVAETHLKKTLKSNKLNRLENTNQFNLDEPDSKKTSKTGPADESNMMVLADTQDKNEKSVLVLPAEPEHTDEYSVEETPDRVGKAELQGNSNKGEFSSVTRIDYNEVAFKDQKQEVVGLDMAFVV